MSAFHKKKETHTHKHNHLISWLILLVIWTQRQQQQQKKKHAVQHVRIGSLVFSSLKSATYNEQDLTKHNNNNKTRFLTKN